MSDIGAGFGQAVPPPPRPVEYTDADPSGWWISLLGGLALIVLGVWLLTNLFESVVVLAWLVGISLIVAGVVEVLALHGSRGGGAAAWVAGGLLVAAGIAVIAWPDITLWALAVMAGIGLALAGIVELADALRNRARGDMPLQLALGGLTLLLGVVVIAWPEATLVVLAVLLGIRAIGSGLVAIGVGLQLRRLGAGPRTA
jgi:uncharacterized membrane protein HdeD (DUF308 family)